MKRIVYLLTSLFLGVIIYSTLTSSSGGIAGQSVSGCGGGCHGTAASLNTTVTLTGLPAAGYVNGAVYSCTLSVTNTVIASAAPFGLRDGFDLTASGGSFTAVTGTALNGTGEIRHSTPRAPVSGTATWIFNWTAPVTGSATITFNMAGNATNGNGSTSGDQWRTSSITLIKAPVLSVTATATPILCNGGLSTITASALNGVPPHQFRLNTGVYQSVSSFLNNPAGTYTVTARDATNATATTVITLNQPAALQFTGLSTSSPSCPGASNGSITIAASGGTGTRTFSITPLGPQTNTNGLFTGLSAQTYTVTVQDANLCSVSTSVVVNNPPSLVFNAPNITPPLCNGGLGSLQVTANGGTGTKTYTINPLGPQANSSGSFSALTAQTYTVQVQDANNCTAITTLTMNQPPPLIVSAFPVSGCQYAPINLSGSPAGGIFSVPNPYTGPSTSYTYTYTDGNGCTGISLPETITVTSVNSGNISVPSSGNSCQTLNQGAGLTGYSNGACQIMASLFGAAMGSTTTCVSFLPGNPSWNGEPYANRVYSITPTTQPASPVTACLYYTAADLASAGISTLSDVSITKVDGNGQLGGGGAVSEIPNSSMIINTVFGGNYEVCFQTSSFSTFYLHAKNPNNVPLLVSLKDFHVTPVGTHHVISWTTTQELDHDYFVVEHSRDGEKFSVLTQQTGQGIQGDQYAYTHQNPENGTHFYRLRMVDRHGNSVYSICRKLITTDKTLTLVEVFPNPSSGNFEVQGIAGTDIWIHDMQGKSIWQQKMSFNRVTVELEHAGTYLLSARTPDGQIQRHKLQVNK